MWALYIAKYHYTDTCTPRITRRIHRDSSPFFTSSYSNSVVGGDAGLLARVGGRDIAARPKLNSRLPAFRPHNARGDGGGWLQALFSIFPSVSFLLLFLYRGPIFNLSSFGHIDAHLWLSMFFYPNNQQQTDRQTEHRART